MKSTVKTKLFYRDIGQGDALVLVHGLAINGEMFAAITYRLSQHRRLIIPDMRGHGVNEDLPGPYTPVTIAEDVLAVLDSESIESTDLLGYSEGASVALQFAKDHPERVNRLILVCAYAHGLGTLGDWLKSFASPLMLHFVGPTTMAELALSVGGGPRVGRAIVQRFAGMMPHDKSKLIPTIKGMATFDARPWLEQIGAHTLIIAGSEDKAAPLSHAKMLADGIKNSRLELVEGAGHALIFTHPQELVDLVQDFLA